VSLRRTIVLGTASVVGACTLLLGASPAFAAGASGTAHSWHHNESLRELAAEDGLRIGTAVNPSELASSSFRSLIADQFSTVTPENEMKWETVEPVRGQYNWAPADKLVAFAKANHQLVRGHTLMWHNQLPGWLTSGVSNGTIGKAELRDILKKHVTDEVTHFKGKIWQWDVANEAFADTSDNPKSGINPNRFWVKNLGPDILADVFRWAHAADPKALLFYNDYAIEDWGVKSTAIYDWVKAQKAAGVPIDGIGFQTHLSTQYGFPDYGGHTMQQNLQRFTDLGLKVAETEVDIRTDVQRVPNDTSTPAKYTNTPLTPALQQKQQDYWKRTLQACLAVRGCISYTVWGVSDNQSWVPSTFPGKGAALLYDEKVQPKPQFFDLQHVLATTDAPHRGGEQAERD
jgi:endo-1,4-beta-xylanase